MSTTETKTGQHTPGPWTVKYSNSGRGKPVTVVPILNWNSISAMSPFGRDYTEATANACLIAAAPELLEACRIVYEAEFGSLAMPAPKRTYWERVQAAIAKAEGR